jgi:hypothetical protein
VYRRHSGHRRRLALRKHGKPRQLEHRRRAERRRRQLVGQFERLGKRLRVEQLRRVEQRGQQLE